MTYIDTHRTAFVALALCALFLVWTLLDATTNRTAASTAPERIVAAHHNSQTLPLLRAARNIDPNPARGGGGITVSDGSALLAETGPLGTEATTASAPLAPDQISLYMVDDGDTLSQVAEMFDVSVSTIVWANDLKSGIDIHPGETLVILPVSGVQHTVAKGDTVGSIAKKYEGNKEEIIAYNGLPEDGTLTVGEVVTVPGGEIEAPKAAPSGTSYTRIATPSRSVSGYFIHPVPGSVKTQGIHGYNGIDFGAAYGTPVRAAAAGTVIVSRQGGWNGGYGNYVVIDHPNGTQTLYAHHSKNEVWQGQKVVQGQVVGRIGSTGRSTGNHLHFEVRGAVNPF